MMNHHFEVRGMTCGHCEMAVKKAIARLDPAAHVDVDRATGKVDVQSEQSRKALARIIAEEGYTVV
jgi:copper chaperone